jgi:hypothetical protein
VNRRLRYLGAAAVLSAAALIVGTTAVPASAAPGDTVVTFTLTAGALSVSVQPTASLGSTATGSASISGQLGTVLVTDNRGGILPWITSASTTTFTGTGGSTALGAVYNAGTFTTTGTVTMTPAIPVTLLSTPLPVAIAALVLGNNTVSWNPTLTVLLPPDALAGSYTGTIHTSVA